MRPYDASKNPGAWTQFTDSGSTPQDTFTIAYDVDQSSLGGPASVENLSLVDSAADPVAWSPGGVSTQVPILGWDPVPGASSYEVDVTPFTSGSCDWTATALTQYDNFGVALDAARERLEPRETVQRPPTSSRGGSRPSRARLLRPRPRRALERPAAT